MRPVSLAYAPTARELKQYSEIHNIPIYKVIIEEFENDYFAYGKVIKNPALHALGAITSGIVTKYIKYLFNALTTGALQKAAFEVEIPAMDAPVHPCKHLVHSSVSKKAYRNSRREARILKKMKSLVVVPSTTKRKRSGSDSRSRNEAFRL